MNIIRRIFNTSIFRVSLIYALLFSLIAAIALISVYKVAETQIQQQTDNRLKFETDVLLNQYYNYSVEGLVQTIDLYNSKQSRSFYLYALINRHDLDLTKFMLNKAELLTPNQIFASLPLGDVVDYVPARKKDDHVRMLLTLLPGNYQLLVASDVNETQKLLSRLFQATLLAISFIFALAIVVGSLMAKKLMKRINDVTRTADDIIEGDLSQRMLVTPRNDEIDRLSRALNKMLARIEELMQGMRGVTDNLAHDLRNPLNRMRNRLESVQFKPAENNDYPTIIDDTMQDVDGLISTFNALLSIARVESGVLREQFTQVDLNRLLDDMAELYEIVGDEKSITWQYHAEANLSLHGHTQLLAQLLTNLLDNAIKYTPEGGHVSLRAHYSVQHEEQTASGNRVNTDKKVDIDKPLLSNDAEGVNDNKTDIATTDLDKANITPSKSKPKYRLLGLSSSIKKPPKTIIKKVLHIVIADNGSGIPEAQYEDVFKRFHRLDSARSSEGNGLGLSLVKAVADLHNASITLSDNKPGLVVTVSFPLDS